MRKSKANHPIVACLLSDHPLALEELQHLLSLPGFQLHPERIKGGLAARPVRTPTVRAQLFVVDSHTPWPVTEALVSRILTRQPAARVLIVGDKFSEDIAFRLLRLRVKGLLTYAELRQQLARAMHALASGGFWLPRPLLSKFVDSILAADHRRRSTVVPADLSQRQRQVLEALLDNLSNKEIANKLNMSERTAKFHVSSLLSRFGVQRRADLILLCYDSGLRRT